MRRQRPIRLQHGTSLHAIVLATAMTFSGASALQAREAGSAETSDTQVRLPENAEIQLAPVLVEGQERSAGQYTATVFTGAEIEDLGLFNSEDVLRMTPGVNINSSGGTNLSSVFIRGVGSMYLSDVTDFMVPMVIDGAPINARHISLGTLDVDRMEILKGPQGTLSGPWGLAGAVDITTRKPTRTFEGYGRAEYGEQGQALLEAAIGGPLTDTLSGRLAVRYSQSEHWVTNDADGAPMANPSNFALRGQIFWDGKQGTTALVTVEHEDVNALPNLLVLMPYGRKPSVDLTPGLYDDVGKSLNRYALEVNHDLASSRITSISSYMNASNMEIAAYDRKIMQAQSGYPSEFWNQDNGRESFFTQDLRLSSLPGDTLTWAAGLFFQHMDASYDTPRNTYGYTSPRFRDFKSNVYAIYGDVTYPVTSALRLTLGLRQNWSSTDYDASFWRGGVGSFDSRAMSESATTGRAMLSYDLTPGTVLHARYARGFAPGGYNMYAAQIADGEPFGGATNDMIEIGFASESEDKTFALTGAAYVNWVSSNHLLAYDSGTYVSSVVNADTRSQGFELQGRWRVGGGLELAAGLSYVDARITSSVFGPSDGDILSGNLVPDVSPWSALVSASYETALPPFLGLSSPMLKSIASYSYVGPRPANPQNSLDLAAYHKLDIHVGVAQDKTELYVRASNLLDDMYDLYGYAVPAANMAYGGMARGRTFVAGISHRF